MHVLATQTATLTDEAIDLQQTPADIVFLSVADTELNCLSTAWHTWEKKQKFTLRLANLGKLTHPMSIDLYCQNTIAKSKMVIIRCLGGKSYFAYGLETIYATCLQHSIPLLILSGDEKYDSELEAFNTVNKKTMQQFFPYFIHGGIENFQSILEMAFCFIAKVKNKNILPPRVLLKAGLWFGNKKNPTLADIKLNKTKPTVAIIFYRALLLGGNVEVVEMLWQTLQRQKLNVVPIFISSLKDEFSQKIIRHIFQKAKPNVVVNLTSFAVSNPSNKILEEGGAVVLQAVLATSTYENWQQSSQGLGARDLAMNIALPEIDGRIFTRAIAFKSLGEYDSQCQISLTKHLPNKNRIEFVSELVWRFAMLGKKPIKQKKIALILANYPNRDGRLGNGVGLDTPASVYNILQSMQKQGYKIDLPKHESEIIEKLKRGITNEKNKNRKITKTLSLKDYENFFGRLPNEVQQKIIKRWGSPKKDIFYLQEKKSFALPILPLGNVLACIQPARGYNIDPATSFHSPDLPPPHNYLAFYFYLRFIFQCDVIAHIGKHGNLEWLPGKSLSLSENCFPESIIGAVPHVYPFIVNDPGEGTQAKRRTSAIITSHLTPPLTRAETYGELQQLENLIDEYYQAQGLDKKRQDYLRQEIFEIIETTGLAKDLNITTIKENASLEKLDAYLCELKEAQIRDGLHIFGKSPRGEQRIDLACALVRLPRLSHFNSGFEDEGDESLLKAMAKDFNFNFNPLDCDYAKKWQGEKPPMLQNVSNSLWRTYGDCIERMELLAKKLLAKELLAKEIKTIKKMPSTKKVLQSLYKEILPTIDSCGTQEINNFLRALSGKFVAPSPSGAPSRGRFDVLPTGRNFFSIDSRSLPTQAAWHLGQKSAELLLKRHCQEHGDWPKSLGLSVWGTSNMRTGGDDIAQALALIGVRPKWDLTANRVVGFEIITLAELARPRVDVTLRISGFFRDAFPMQIEFFDKAVKAVADLDEDEKLNPLALHVKQESKKLMQAGLEESQSKQLASFRIFGSKPGAYGAGLQALIDENGWQSRADFAEAYLAFGSYAYGEKTQGQETKQQFIKRLKSIEAIVHNQDNREHDILDSDDYYQFEGGMAASVEHLRGEKVPIYHNDHSRPERPVIHTLEEEIAKVVRSRLVNPKWIRGVMRHKYKGAFEMAASVDYLFAFAATTGAVKDYHFDAVYQAFLLDEEVCNFLQTHNPHALRDIAGRLLQALEKGLWTSRRNSVKMDLMKFSGGQQIKDKES